MNKENLAKEKSGLATAGLVLGIIGISLSFIPILNNASFFLGILAVIFGIIPLLKKTSKGKAIAALVLGVLSIVITITLQNSWSKSIDDVSKSLDDVSNELDTMTGKNTEEVLKNIDVNIGNLETSVDEYGLIDSKLVVKVTNKYKEKKSFSITIEAISSDGSRIAENTVYANNLSSGQSQSFEIFTYINSEKFEAMKNAKFKIVEASIY